MLKKLILALLLTVPLLAQAKPITLKVRPNMVSSSSPYTEATIIVERDPANRQMVLLWGNRDIGIAGSSYYQLEGDQAERRFTKVIRFRETGEYEVKAVVIRNDDTYFSDSQTVIVR